MAEEKVAMPQAPRCPDGALRRQVLDEWLQACEDLHGALRMSAGSRPRIWDEKLAMVSKVTDLFGRVEFAWSFHPPVVGSNGH